jgi:hypothetical protein
MHGAEQLYAHRTSIGAPRCRVNPSNLVFIDLRVLEFLAFNDVRQSAVKRGS